jgi:tetratricopeptide (TPR) repeat protein
MNKPEQAVADAQDLMRLSNGLIQRMYLARAYALDGNRREAIAILDAVLHDSKRRYLPPYYIAILHAALGDRDGAFTYLDKSFDEHSSAMMLLHIEPTLDSIRSDPRFQGLLRRVAQTAR